MFQQRVAPSQQQDIQIEMGEHFLADFYFVNAEADGMGEPFPFHGGHFRQGFFQRLGHDLRMGCAMRHVANVM